MPRRLRLVTREAGTLEVQAIYQMGDVWEAAWAPLQATGFAEVFSSVSDEVMNHAIRGYTKPFVEALGLPPQGALRKLPKEHRQCEQRLRCPSFTPGCVTTDPKMPDCFQPSGVPEGARTLAYEAVRLWREGVYIVVVKESVDAYRTYPRAARR